MTEHHRDDCSCALHGSTASQTLQEMDFERGLWQPANEGDEERVRKLLRSGHVVNDRDSSGYTPLHYACRNGQLLICETLLDSGANVNSQTPGGATGLHRAAYCGHSGVVKLLLASGADASVTDSDGKTPLHKACEGGRLEVAKQLIGRYPAALEVADKRGGIPRDLVNNFNEQWNLTLLQHSIDQ